MWFDGFELFLESLTVESKQWFLTKPKPYFTGLQSLISLESPVLSYSKDLNGASIAQKKGSDAIRKQCRVCIC